jgi:hypothetical protein
LPLIYLVGRYLPTTLPSGRIPTYLPRYPGSGKTTARERWALNPGLDVDTEKLPGDPQHRGICTRTHFINSSHDCKYDLCAHRKASLYSASLHICAIPGNISSRQPSFRPSYRPLAPYPDSMQHDGSMVRGEDTSKPAVGIQQMILFLQDSFCRHQTSDSAHFEENKI